MSVFATVHLAFCSHQGPSPLLNSQQKTSLVSGRWQHPQGSGHLRRPRRLASKQLCSVSHGLQSPSSSRLARRRGSAQGVAGQAFLSSVTKINMDCHGMGSPWFGPQEGSAFFSAKRRGSIGHIPDTAMSLNRTRPHWQTQTTTRQIDARCITGSQGVPLSKFCLRHRCQSLLPVTCPSGACRGFHQHAACDQAIG